MPSLSRAPALRKTAAAAAAVSPQGTIVVRDDDGELVIVAEGRHVSGSQPPYPGASKGTKGHGNAYLSAAAPPPNLDGAAPPPHRDAAAPPPDRDIPTHGDSADYAALADGTATANINLVPGLSTHTTGRSKNHVSGAAAAAPPLSEILVDDSNDVNKEEYLTAAAPQPHLVLLDGTATAPSKHTKEVLNFADSSDEAEGYFSPDSPDESEGSDHQNEISHIFICHGTCDTWPTIGEDSIPSLLSAALKARDLHNPPAVVMFDAGKSGLFSENDMLVFPLRRVFRSANASNMDEFLDAIFGNVIQDFAENLDGAYLFACCDGSESRKCSVIGEISLSMVTNEIESGKLGVLAHAFACSHLSRWDTTSAELLVFKGDGESVEYNDCNPLVLRQVLNDLSGNNLFKTYDYENNEVGHFWTTLLAFLESAAELRINLVPDLDLTVLRSQIIKLQALVWKLHELCETCQVSFEWKKPIALELKFCQRAVYSFARSVRNTVVSASELSAFAPTETELKIQRGFDQIEELLSTGKSLNPLVESLGGKPYPLGTKFLVPICGMTRMSWKEKFYATKE